MIHHTSTTNTPKIEVSKTIQMPLRPMQKGSEDRPRSDNDEGWSDYSDDEDDQMEGAKAVEETFDQSFQKIMQEKPSPEKYQKLACLAHDVCLPCIHRSFLTPPQHPLQIKFVYAAGLHSLLSLTIFSALSPSHIIKLLFTETYGKVIISELALPGKKYTKNKGFIVLILDICR